MTTTSINWDELNRVTFTYEEVTVEQAEAWLANPHPRQRRSGLKKVKTYADLMEAGRWEAIVPDGVMLTTPEDGGGLMNAAHRLRAIVKTQRPQVLLVVRNVPARIFDVIDVPSVRSARQFVDGTDGENQQQAARWLMWYESRFAQKPSRTAMSYQLREVIEYAEAHADEIAPATLAAGAVKLGAKIPCGLHAAILVLARRARVSDETLTAWTDGLTTGANIPLGDPRLVLRSIYPRRPRQLDDWYYIVAALNAFVTGESVKLTKVPEFAWPRVGESRLDFQRRLTAAKNRRAYSALSPKKRLNPKSTVTADAYVMQEVMNTTGKTLADFR